MHAQKPSLYFHDSEVEINLLTIRSTLQHIPHGINMLLVHLLVNHVTTGILHILLAIHIAQAYHQLIALIHKICQTREDLTEYRIVIANVHQHEIVLALLTAILVCSITKLIVLKIIACKANDTRVIPIPLFQEFSHKNKFCLTLNKYCQSALIHPSYCWL